VRASATDPAYTFLNVSNLNWFFLPIPKGAKTRANWMFLPTMVLAAAAKNPDAGWAWLHFMSSPEGYDARGTPETSPSVRRSRANSPRLTSQPLLVERGIMKAWRDSEPTLHQPPQVPYYQTVLAEITRTWGTVWSGEKTAKQAMEEVVPTINNMLAQY